jgi:hypothetical protein
MIDPIPGVKKHAPEPSAPPPPRPDAAPEVKAAERQQRVPPSGPVLDVRLDAETMRLYTEIRDPETNRVLFRLPAAYQGEEKDSPVGTAFEA